MAKWISNYENFDPPTNYGLPIMKLLEYYICRPFARGNFDDHQSVGPRIIYAYIF